jgi:hypothetical protein
VVHEPRSLFGALDHSREGSVDPTSFWDKTLRGVSGGVGGVRLVAETAAHETNALLGTTSQGQAHGTDDETLEMYFADGKRRAERKLRLVRHPSSEGEVAHFDDDGVDDGALPTEENAYAPRLPPRDTFAPPPRVDRFHPESLVDVTALRNAASKVESSYKNYEDLDESRNSENPRSPEHVPLSPFDTLESHSFPGDTGTAGISFAVSKITHREIDGSTHTHQHKLPQVQSEEQLGFQPWRLADLEDGVEHDLVSDSPPERQKDFIDESEMDRDEVDGYGTRSVMGKHSFKTALNRQSSIANRKDLLWKLSSSYLSNDVPSIQKSLVQHVEYTLARRRYKFDRGSFYQATAHSVRDRLIERWTDTQQFYASKDSKRMYYLSLEFLVGRSMGNAVSNLGLRGAYAEALRQLGYDLEDIMAQEKEPALGNGGLGRLASCFLDTLATLNYPAWGYGLRYKYGMFEQRLVNGKQCEFPDYWLTRGNPWEVERLDVKYNVRLYGKVMTVRNFPVYHAPPARLRVLVPPKRASPLPITTTVYP